VVHSPFHRALAIPTGVYGNDGGFGGGGSS